MKKNLSIIIEGSFENEAEHEHASMLLSMFAHETKYQLEKRNPTTQVTVSISGVEKQPNEWPVKSTM